MLTTGQVTLFDAPRNQIPLHVRGGHILPVQQPGNTTHQRLGSETVCVNELLTHVEVE